MKINSVLLFSLLFSASSQMFSQVFESEPNNNATEANVLQMDDSIYASITPYEDIDYFKIVTYSDEDTLQVLIRNRNNSQLTGSAEIFDAAGNTILYDFYNYIGVNLTFAAPYSGTYYVRFAHYSGTFPNKEKRSKIKNPPPALSAAEGDYLIKLKKFVPSSPLITYFSLYDIYYNKAKGNVGFYANGLNTSVSLYNGTTFNFPDTVNTLGMTYLNGAITEMTPQTIYIVKAEAKNDSGKSSSSLTFTTPGKPDFWDIKTVDTLSSSYDFFFISFVNERFGCIFANDFYTTSDGGDTWLTIENNLGLFCGFAIDSLNIIAGTWDAGIYKTADGGLTWTAVNSPLSNVSYIYFVNRDTGFAIGGAGLIVKTTDGGSSWTERNSNVSDNLNIICFPDEKNGWISGTQGVILRTSDGGDNWIKQNSSTQDNLYGCSFIDSLRGFALTHQKLFSTTDGGTNWHEKQLTRDYLDISFRGQYGIMVGDQGVISFTADAGTTWGLHKSGTYNQLYWVTKAGSQWITIGMFNTILKSKYNLVNVEDKPEVLHSFKLNQNYPNPFNPRTIIRYSIPQKVFTSIKIYNLLGKEVALLVNEEQSAGMHEVEFNASNLASGVYIYKITAGSYTESKKLVFMK